MDGPGDFGGRPGGEQGGEQAGEGGGTRLVERLEREIAGAGPEAAEAALRSLLEGPTLPDFLAEVTAYRRRAFPATVKQVRRVEIQDETVKRRIGEIPISTLRDHALGAPEHAFYCLARPPRVVRLSAESAVKQVINHPDLTTEDYRRLPEVIRRGRKLREPEGHHLAFFLEIDSRYSYKAVVKRTSNDEVFLTTFQKIGNSDVPRAERRSLKKSRRRAPDSRGSRPAHRHDPVAHGGASHPGEAGNPT